MPRPVEGVAQAEVLLHLRAAVDTAIRYPTQANTERALSIARNYPRAMRSAHLIHNLGQRRWDWLTEHGFYAAMDASSEDDRMQGTVGPEYRG